MYVTISNTTPGGEIEYTDYTEIRNLSFAPQGDVSGSAMPVNEFTVDIVTADELRLGETAELYDDLDNLWASYWIANVNRIDEKTVRVTARSLFFLMDNAGDMAAEYYNAKSATTAIEECVEAPGSRFSAAMLEIDSSFDNATVTGFVPEQSARERLQWILMAIGAQVKTCFNNVVQILPIDSTATLIPFNQTYMRPSVTNNDWVTELRVTAYSFQTVSPATEQVEVSYVWVKDAHHKKPVKRAVKKVTVVDNTEIPSTALTDGTSYYIATEQVFTLTNSAAPAAAPENVMTVEGVYLINSGNVSAILSRLAARYFKRTEIELDVLNNCAYAPGDKVIVYGGENTLYSGFIEGAEFTFGVMAKSRLKVVGIDDVAGAKLTILYKCAQEKLGSATYFLPQGYAYSIDNPYFDKIKRNVRRVYYPLTPATTGTMGSSDTTVTKQYAIALEFQNKILRVISVDDITTQTESGMTVGVIA